MYSASYFLGPFVCEIFQYASFIAFSLTGARIRASTASQIMAHHEPKFITSGIEVGWVFNLKH